MTENPDKTPPQTIEQRHDSWGLPVARIIPPTIVAARSSNPSDKPLDKKLGYALGDAMINYAKVIGDVTDAGGISILFDLFEHLAEEMIRDYGTEADDLLAIVREVDRKWQAV